MKKIVILSFYNGLVDRGVESFVKHLAPLLTKKSQVMVLQAGAPSGREKYEVKRIKINQEHLYSGWGQISFTIRALKYINQKKPAIIYPLNGRWQALLCRIYSAFTKTKLVIGGHAGIGRDDLFNLLLWPDVFVALSKKGKVWADRWTPHVKKLIIPHGVDSKMFNPTVNSVNFGLSRPIVLTVAGKESFKQVDLTITAVAKVPKASLLVVGNISKKTINLGKKKLGNRFKVARYPHDRMPQIYNSADIFSLASDRREAFGVSYLEAMACNLPVVATNDDLRKELIGKAGILVDPQNSADYAKALSMAVSNNWGNKPREQALRFSWQKVAEKYQKLFDKLAL